MVEGNPKDLLAAFPPLEDYFEIVNNCIFFSFLNIADCN